MNVAALHSALQVARQHVENLREVLKKALLQLNFGRAAAVAAVLLVAAPVGPLPVNACMGAC